MDVEEKVENFTKRNTTEIVPLGEDPNWLKEMKAKEQESVSLIRTAVEKGYDPAFISQLMDLQERNDKRIAEQAYVKAMANFKKNPPKIDKDRHVQYDTQKGRVDYRHASLANVTEKISSALGENGLSASWKTEQENGVIKVTCSITHELGHGESTSLSGAADLTGSKNAIQAVGSTISYLQRYTLLALTGLATHDMDDDGIESDNPEGGGDFISPEQLATLVKKVEQSKINEKAFLKSLGVETLSELPVSKFNKALIPLNARIKQNK